MKTSSAKPKAHALKAAKKPVIPDHEVIRCIGRGSYGEVWLAQGVTGALRAVKVVRREDFELERTFEREFQGILSFEPISRDHPGLVDILHVGRHASEDFYYYVMELADDRETGSKINPVDYEPRTLGTDKSTRKKIDLDSVVEIGTVLADALTHLHDKGLSHRDIKPSNIIFVNGRAKLADIGLVAQTGQQTFVGTEGFVPPEGPGSSLADIYSLGMVLYEISTGKDRMQFPELAEDLGPAHQKLRRRMLNEVICKACDPNPRRRFPTAKHLSDALRAVRRGRYQKPLIPRAAALVALSALVGFGVVWARNGSAPWPPGRFADSNPSPQDKPVVPARQRVGSILITTDQPGASVCQGDKVLGQTPLPLEGLPVGKFKYTLKLEGYEDILRDVVIHEGRNENAWETFTQRAIPKPGVAWKNSLEMRLEPEGDLHVSPTPVSYEQYLDLMGFSAEDVVDVSGKNGLIKAVCVPPPDAAKFCDALLSRDIARGLLKENSYVYQPRVSNPPAAEPPAAETQGYVMFQVALRKREFGEVHIITDPPGASVFIGDTKLDGVTPMTLPHEQAGQLRFVIRLRGYEDRAIDGTLEPGKRLPFEEKLVKSKSATLGLLFENSLGMRFVPVGEGLLVSIWETRVKDFAASGIPQQTVDIPQTPDHPVTTVDREQAKQFCQWLTQKERALGLLPPDLEYRLPTDLEWSQAADLRERQDRPDPSSRNQTVRGVYIWGVGTSAWPPPKDKEKLPGNFSDESRSKGEGRVKESETLAQVKYPDKGKYNDGYAYTAPAGSFAPNVFGLYDMAGNVSEWVSDNFGGQHFAEYGVTRGGSWNDWEKGVLLSSARNAIKADLKDGIYGFRCVIAKVP